MISMTAVGAFYLKEKSLKSYNEKALRVIYNYLISIDLHS